jgi:hypothetical protein
LVLLSHLSRDAFKAALPREHEPFDGRRGFGSLFVDSRLTQRIQFDQVKLVDGGEKASLVFRIGANPGLELVGGVRVKYGLVGLGVCASTPGHRAGVGIRPSTTHVGLIITLTGAAPAGGAGGGATAATPGQVPGFLLSETTLFPQVGGDDLGTLSPLGSEFIDGGDGFLGFLGDSDGFQKAHFVGKLFGGGAYESRSVIASATGPTTFFAGAVGIGCLEGLGEVRKSGKFRPDGIGIGQNVRGCSVGPITAR